MLIEHGGKTPRIHETAWIAPNATISGDVEIGANTRVLYGAVITAEGGPVEVGEQCVVMENAVLRGTRRHPLQISNRVLVGPHAHLSGCRVDEECFLATGAAVFNGARLGKRVEVRINGVVHLKTVLPDDGLVPIGWVAVGDPAEVLPPDDHDAIWAAQEPLDFPKQVFGVTRGPEMMTQIMARYTRALSEHQHDRIIDP
ncbi:MAG: gamma carbonic anhydrase family protein [Acidimicrobiia bacterium]|nr:gamma carbonic anhydrase family protein [Acidimicrobiia bacterium]